MTVCELIKCLEKCDCEAMIILRDSYNDEYQLETVIAETTLYGDKRQEVIFYFN